MGKITYSRATDIAQLIRNRANDFDFDCNGRDDPVRLTDPYLLA